MPLSGTSSIDRYASRDSINRFHPPTSLPSRLPLGAARAPGWALSRSVARSSAVLRFKGSRLSSQLPKSPRKACFTFAMTQE